MNQYPIQNTQILLFKAQAKNFSESGFDPQGYILLSYAGHLDLAVFHGSDLPANLAHGLDVALPLSTQARPANVVRFFQRADVCVLLARLREGHDIRWNGSYNVGVFSTTAQNALEGLHGLLKDFNQSENAAALQHA